MSIGNFGFSFSFVFYVCCDFLLIAELMMVSIGNAGCESRNSFVKIGKFMTGVVFLSMFSKI